MDGPRQPRYTPAVLPADTWLGLALLLLAAGVQGFLGFGFGIVSMAGLTLLTDVVHASGVVNLTGLAITLAMLVGLRRHVHWPTTARLGPFVLLGVFGGVAALRSFDGTWLVRGLGVTVMGIAAWNLARPRLSAGSGVASGALASVTAGLLGGAFNTGGPPLVAWLYRRPGSPRELQGTLQSLFLCISLSRVPVAASQGLMAAGVWREAALALPFVGVGLLFGMALSARTDPSRFRTLSWSAFAVVGVVLVLSTLGIGPSRP